MASGIDPKLSGLLDLINLKLPWLDPLFGLHAGQKPDQTIRVELGDGLIVVFSVARDKWAANSIVFEGDKALFNKVVTEKVKGQDLVFLWAVNRIRNTFIDMAELLRTGDPTTAEWLDGQLARLNADLVKPLP